MSELRIARYEPAHKALWDDFIARSKNGTFLFYRDYMDYHADRFFDHSLLFFQNDQLLALLPANISDNTIVSHGGLTYGGIVSDRALKTSTMLALFELLISWLREQQIASLTYKAIPHIYHRIPAEEDLYALFLNRARLVRRDLSSAVYLSERLPLSKGRKSEISRAKSRGVEVKQTDDYETFMSIEEEHLQTKYNRKPVHTAAELKSLASKFPDNIKLFCAYASNSMLGGVVIYESSMVAHAQYISASEQGKEWGALDLILSSLMNNEFALKRWFDFGISTDQNGRYLNTGLVANKESFGARAIAYDFYQLDITP